MERRTKIILVLILILVIAGGVFGFVKIIQNEHKSRIEPCINVCEKMGGIKAEVTSFNIKCLCTMEDGSIKIGW